MNKKETRVDFYILSGGGENGYMRYTCRLTEKAYKLKHRIYIYVSNSIDARKIDELLWTFNQGSFIPHECLDGDAAPSSHDSPVVIAYNGGAPFACTTPEGYDLLINLSQEIPQFYKQFDRVAEVVADQDADRKSTRLNSSHTDISRMPSSA